MVSNPGDGIVPASFSLAPSSAHPSLMTECATHPSTGSDNLGLPTSFSFALFRGSSARIGSETLTPGLFSLGDTGGVLLEAAGTLPPAATGTHLSWLLAVRESHRPSPPILQSSWPYLQCSSPCLHPRTAAPPPVVGIPSQSLR